MNRIFIRTSQGNDALAHPSGVLSGDEKRLMELVDGVLSLGEIKQRVPLSVQRVLQSTFTRLLTAGYVAESTGGDPVKAPKDPSYEDTQPLPKLVGTADREQARRAELEQEVVALRMELAVLRARVGAADAAAESQIAADSARNKLEEIEAAASFEAQAAADQQSVQDDTYQHNTAPMATGEKSAELTEASRLRPYPYYGKLRGVDFFKAFGNAELLKFLDMAKWQTVEAGQTILHAGDVGMPFFIIVTGSVSVFYEMTLLATLERGDIFGEFSHLSGEFPLRSAQVKADTVCELLMVDPLDIEFSTLQIRLHVAEAMLRGQVRKVLRANQMLNNLSNSSEDV